MINASSTVSCPGVHSSQLLLQTSTADDAVDEMKARRLHSALEQIRSRGQREANDKLSVLDELHSFANTINGLDLPATRSQSDQHHQPMTYSDRLSQTRSDLKLLEQLVGQTFHWRPQPSATVAESDTVDHQVLHRCYLLSLYGFHHSLTYACHYCKLLRQMHVK